MNDFKRLRFGNILGIVDAYGAVHSRFTYDEVECHQSFWPTNTYVRWRWCFREGIYSLVSCKPSEEELESIRNHLTHKYGIKWYDNGYHDIDFLMKKFGEEKNH